MSEIATLAGGCFWCTEAIMRRLAGVTKVTSGYTGGVTINPTYEEVCSGQTGHAEAVQVEFDPQVISYQKILEVFLATHDPTTRDRQGYDVGSQYRSAIFYHDDVQKKVAEQTTAQIKGAVTEIVPAGEFYPAEIDHQQYYEINRNVPYCRAIIDPKIKKLMQKFGEKVQPGYKE